MGASRGFVFFPGKADPPVAFHVSCPRSCVVGQGSREGPHLLGCWEVRAVLIGWEGTAERERAFVS